jgi:putative hydrolase of the HAD superfamily
MTSVRAIIFDLGGTLIDWPDWDADVEGRWALSYDYLVATLPGEHWPERGRYIQAMREAEKNHWVQVEQRQASSTPTDLLRDGFERMGS